MFPKPKYVIFISFLLRPNLSTKKSGLPDFYSVKLDVIGFAQKPHFWNQGTSYINALYLVSQELFDLYLKLIKMTRESRRVLLHYHNELARSLSRVVAARHSLRRLARVRFGINLGCSKFGGRRASSTIGLFAVKSVL